MSQIISDVVDVLTGGIITILLPSVDFETLNILFDVSYVYSILYEYTVPSIFTSNVLLISIRFSESLQLNTIFCEVLDTGFGGTGNLYVPYVNVLLLFPLHSAVAVMVLPDVDVPDVADHSDVYPVFIVVYDEFLSGVGNA